MLSSRVLPFLGTCILMLTQELLIPFSLFFRGQSKCIRPGSMISTARYTPTHDGTGNLPQPRFGGVDRINITPSQIQQKVFKGLWPLTPENFSLLLHRLKMLLIKCHLALSPLSSLLSTSRIWLIPQAQHVKVYFLSPYILRVLLAHPRWPHR